MMLSSKKCIIENKRNRRNRIKKVNIKFGVSKIKKVKINITTKQEGQEDIVFMTCGNFEGDSEKMVFIYDESQITGLDNTTTRMEITDEVVTITRSGDFASKIKFTTECEDCSFYQTPYGSLRLRIITKEIDIVKEFSKEMKECKAFVDIRYQTEIEGDLQGETNLNISVDFNETCD